MKKITLFLTAILLSLATLAQAPMGINYQTVIRDGDGNILPDTELSLQMTIRSGAPDGAVVYAETHETTTNAFGLINLVIGYGTPLNNAFSDINWSDSDKYLETAIDLDGNGSYTIMGVTQFLSVPYALNSGTTETYEETDPEFNAWDKSTGITITENQITDLQDYLTEELDGDPTNELQTLSQAGNTVTLSQGGGTISVADNDNLPANELQQLSKVGSTVSLSQGGGSFIDEVNDADADPVNEIQTVAEQDYQITLSQGGGSFITGVKSYTQAAIDAMTPYNGLTIHNSTTNCINYYYINAWFEACGTCTPQPTQAIAGNDTIVYGVVLSVILNANTPQMGEGWWSVLAGEGGTFEEVTNPQTLFTGQPGVIYILQWAISTICDTTYDEVKVATWQCGMPIRDERDWQNYETVQIGEQCWMAENLNIGTRISGSSNQANNGTIEKYCYGNSDEICDIYGGLYQWYEMMQYLTTEGVQGICPSGWHLPTDAEWCELEQEVDPSITCSSNGWRGVDGGGKLKETGTSHWNSPNTGATNSSGFTALPSGWRSTNGSFYDMSQFCLWWCSSGALYRQTYYGYAQVGRENNDPSMGFSVRCLKDN